MTKNSRSAASRADHLKPHQFKPGQSGNPRGARPNPYTKAIRAALPPEEFAKIVTKAAIDGDSRVIVALLDRHYPKPDVALKLDAQLPGGGAASASIRVEFVEPDTAE